MALGAQITAVGMFDNSLNNAATQQDITVNGTGVTSLPQTITFPAITGTHDALTSYTLSATAASGLTVAFASASPTICTVSGSTASLLIPGGAADSRHASRQRRIHSRTHGRRGLRRLQGHAEYRLPNRYRNQICGFHAHALCDSQQQPGRHLLRRRGLSQRLHPSTAPQPRCSRKAPVRWKPTRPAARFSTPTRANSAAEHPRPPGSAGNHLPVPPEPTTD